MGRRWGKEVVGWLWRLSACSGLPQKEYLFPACTPACSQVSRVPLERLVMLVKTLRLRGKAARVLAELPDPPDAAAVTAAVSNLQSIGALYSNETLTPLGR